MPMPSLEFALYWFLIPAGALCWTAIIVGGMALWLWLKESK
jgi:hypothetical protein